MVQLNWPDINPHHSQNALNHLASLEADFEALDACVKISSSKHHKLPSSLQKDIIKAIVKVFSDDDYPYETSEADENLIGGLILKHITAEAAERARDRIPLELYHDLRQSYKQLVAKLNELVDLIDLEARTRVEERGVSTFQEESPELETMHKIGESVSRHSEEVRPAALSNGHDTQERAGQADLSREQRRDATETVDRPKKKGRKRKKRDGIEQAKGRDKASATGDHGGILEIMPNQHRVEEVDVHEGGVYSEAETDDQDDHEGLVRMFKDTEAQCEHIRLQLQDFESEHLEDSTMWNVADELIEDEDMVETHVVEEDNADAELLEGDTLVNDPNDQAQRPNDQADNQARFERNEQFQQGREVKQEMEDPDASSLITFNIEHQASVNQLNDMGSDGILQKLSSSLEAMRSSGYDVPDSIQFTNAMLLGSGDVQVHAHAGSKEDIERLSRIRGWDLEFEKNISAPATSYAVETPRISVDSLNMQTRKHKATAIRELLEENLRFVVSLRSIDDIRNIRWCKGYKKESSLVIEFRTGQQADEVLDAGVFFSGKHYKCQSVDQKLRRCGRCQALGHQKKSCSSALRCGRCSLQHPTSDCTSNITRCANCHGAHQAKAAKCPAKKAHKQQLRYINPSTLREETDNEETAPEPQRRTAALSLPSPDSMPTSPNIEREIKVEENESLQNTGYVRENHQGRAAAPRHTSMPANPPHEPHIKAEVGEPTQEMDLAQNHTPDLTIIQRQMENLQRQLENLQKQLENLEKDVERPSLPQHPHSRRRKRRADEMLMGGSSSYARRRPKRARQSKDDYTIRNRSLLPIDWDISPLPGSLPGQRMPRQVFLRKL